MSYNETYVNDDIWRKRQEEVKKDEAFVIKTKSKIEEIDRYINNKKNDYANICNNNEKRLDHALSSLMDSFNKSMDSIKTAGDMAVINAKNNFKNQVSDIRSDIKKTGADISIINVKINEVATAFNETFKSIVDAQNSEADKANCYATHLKDILDQISHLYPEIHKPMEYNGLVNKYNNLNNNISSGTYLADIAVAQTGILEASKLLTELIAINEHANIMLQEIYKECSDIKKNMMKLTSDEAVLSIVVDGETEEYEYNIRRWSERLCDGLSFNDIEKEYCQQEEKLGRTCSIEELQIIKQNLDVIKRKLSLCDSESRELMMGAVAAANTAESMVSALNAAGWDITTVENNDERDPITMKGDDGAGNEVAVVISSGGESPSVSWYIDDDDSVQKEMKEEALRNELCDCGIGTVYTERDIKNCERINSADDFVDKTMTDSLI